MNADALISALSEWVREILKVTDPAILGYFLLINTSYLILIVLATVEFVHHVRRAPLAGFEEMYPSPLTQPVSVLVPAHNEEVGIVEAVHAMLALRYPVFVAEPVSWTEAPSTLPVQVALPYHPVFELLAPLAVEKYSFHRYSRWGDLGVAVLTSIVENLGYRQLTAVWRVQGASSALIGSQHEWGVMTRTGFGGRRMS